MIPLEDVKEYDFLLKLTLKIKKDYAIQSQKYGCSTYNGSAFSLYYHRNEEVSPYARENEISETFPLVDALKIKEPNMEL
jgi:hypothetical protein